MQEDAIMANHCDLLIRNLTVADGTGKPACPGSVVAATEERIAADLQSATSLGLKQAGSGSKSSRTEVMLKKRRKGIQSVPVASYPTWMRR